jgi:NAD(P)-dependent dehydrogenase (short-subunit alcohol dehydrogenase family)
LIDFDITNRVALVTGGGTGIGLGIARGLAEQGATVILAGRRADVVGNAAEELRAAGGRAEAFPLDVTSTTDIDRAFAEIARRHARLDILVTSAGTNRRKPTLDYDEESWDAVLDTNLKSTFFCAQAAARIMKEQGHGRIMFIGSVGSHLASPMQTGYCPSKAGVDQLAKVMAIELAPLGITVNVISPGPVRTPLSEHLFSDPEWIRRTVARVPMGRVGDPSDLAGIAVFLASAAASYITGQVIYVDGGLSTGN